MGVETMSGIKQVTQLENDVQKYFERECRLPQQGSSKIECILVLRSDGELALFHPVGQMPRDCADMSEVEKRLPSNQTLATARKEISIWHFSSYCIETGGDRKCFW